MSETLPVTKCALCQHEFRSKVPIIGEASGIRMGRLFNAVSQHLATKHQAEPQVQELIAFSVLASVLSTDPDIQEAQHKARHVMHRRTVDPKWGPEPFADGVLRPAVEAIAAGEYDRTPDGDRVELTTNIMKLVTEVRDALLEQGQFAPQPPQPEPVVQA